MNWLRNTRSLLSQIIVRCKAPSSQCHAVSRRWRLMQELGLLRGRGSAHIINPALRPQSASRWYHQPRKAAAAAATAITMSATVMAVRSQYEQEIVPCSYRSHLVLHSDQELRHLGESAFAEEKNDYLKRNMVFHPHDPDSVRVRLILDRIVRAAHRGLGIDDSSDAPMLRVTEKKRRRRWGKEASSSASKPHTSHLRGLNWEVIIVRDRRRNVMCTPAGKIMVFQGLFDWFKTDEEIAALLAHEVGHIIARHTADITKSDWSPQLVTKIFKRRFELEADYIGMLLLGAAGFDPRWALVMTEKMAYFEGASALTNIFPAHPNPKKRSRLLSQPKVMEEAMELYREVTAMYKVIDQYFR